MGGRVSSAANIVHPPESAEQLPVALLVDLKSNQWLYARNPDTQFLPASMTKVMTSYVAFELLAQKNLNPEDLFTVSAGAAQMWSGRGSSMHLRSGQSVSVDNLLRGLTAVSANDGAFVLAEGVAGSSAAWAKMMNREARKLGMVNSFFGTPSGWPDGGITHVTARDMVSLGQALITRHPDFYKIYYGKKGFRWNNVEGYNHDPLIGKVEGADGIKTGFTNEAGYTFLGSVKRDDRRIIMVIGGANSEAQRAQAAIDLAEWAYSAWDSYHLFPKSAIIGNARVQGGMKHAVPLQASQIIGLAVPKSMKLSTINLTIVYKGPLQAPVSKGDHVANLVISGPNMATRQIPLEAAVLIEKGNLFTRLMTGFINLWG